MFFCCEGCKQVFRMLVEAQAASDDPDPTPFRETALFKECLRMGIIPQSEDDLKPPPVLRDKTSGTSSQIVDNVPDQDSLLKLSFQLEGMWCPACAWLIDETLKNIPGVINPSTRFSTDTFHCRYDPVRTAPEEIIRSIRKLGYQPLESPEDMLVERRREFFRFAVSAVFAMNVMMLSFALYSGFFTRLTPDAVAYLSWPIFLFASVPFFYGGWNIHRRAWHGLQSAVFTMETLISTASGSAFFYSVFNLVHGSIHLYFDTASMLITLTLLGKKIEANAKEHVLKDLSALFALNPSKVKLVTDKYPVGRYVAIGMLQKGDLFIVDEGELIPADGVVASGEGLVDESAMTGEAVPVRKRPDQRLHSGTTVVRGTFRVKAEAVGEDSTMGQMIRIIQRGLDEKSVFEGTTDKFLVAFVPLILSLAIATGIYCRAVGNGFESALVRAITVMVISCPCALGIAIPLARVAGISIAGRKGILVREFSSFERADAVDAFVFDKTGTLTEGSYKLREIVPFAPFGRKEMLSVASGLEASAGHYLADEIRRCAAAEGLVPEEVNSLSIHDNGISGVWHGHVVRIGSIDFVPEARTRKDAADLADDSQSRVYMSCGGVLAAIFMFGDRIRDGAPGVIEALQQCGGRVILVSGDETRTAQKIGRTIGILECYGGRLPLQKAAFIERLKEEGFRTAMIGDGINDAPALMAADLSFAVYSGPFLGKEAADITLMRSDPRQVLTFLALAGKVNRKIFQNLLCSVVYNALGIPFAMAGLLTPLVAVTAMLLSSLTVIGNTLLLIRRAG